MSKEKRLCLEGTHSFRERVYQRGSTLNTTILIGIYISLTLSFILVLRDDTVAWMKSLVEPFRTTWPCLPKWFVCFIIMGAISPGRAEDLGFENSPHPLHWQNNSTPSVLYVRLGYYLQIMPDEKVGGVRDHRPFLNVTHITSEKNTTAIQSTDTKLFLCMDAKSKVYARPTFIKMDCEWVEQLLPNFYSAYLHKHHMLKKDIAAGRPRDIPFYLGMDRNGSMRLGKESRKKFRSSQFIRSSVNASFQPSTSSTSLTTDTNTLPTVIAKTTARRKPLKIGCKGLKIKYCRRMRRRRKQGKSIKHAKRHRKCKRRRFSLEGKTLQDIRKLKRLRKQCSRIQRKRSERKRKVSRTSVSTPKPSRAPRRGPHRTPRHRV